MSVKPTKAMVLAAGLGVRMRPLTDQMPKPLVPVAGRPLLDHVLDKLADAGVGEAVVNVHYLPDQIIAHVAARTRPRVIISDERDQVLGTGGGVVKALAAARPRPVLPCQCRHHVDRRRAAQSGAAGRNVRSRAHGHPVVDGADHQQHRLRRQRRLCHAARRRAAQAPGTPGGSLRLCRCRDHVAGAVRRRAGRRIFADEDVRPRQRAGAAVRPAARRRMDACRNPRRGQARRKRRFSKAWRRSWVLSAVLRSARTQNHQNNPMQSRRRVGKGVLRITPTNA